MNFKLTITIILVCLTAAGSMLINSCKKTTSARYARSTPLPFHVPEGFPATVFDLISNPLTEEGFALGKKLFHDNRLSKNADVTCGSCHQQLAAFTTFDHDLGHGTNHQHTRRNVPAIFNMAWHHEFEWDGKVSKLSDQPLACMTAPEKMGEAVTTVIEKLRSDADYKQMFGEAFGDENITGERISNALTQFVVMLVSSGSKYDSVKKGLAVFNASEESGYQLFTDHCASCHTEPLFTDLSYRNNGLAFNTFHPDAGRMEVSGNPEDSMKYKVPTLRNVMLTAYYAHDGRFVAVSQMLDHYSTGNMHGTTVDPLLRNNIPLTNLEKFYLQEFLFTLSDKSLTGDPRFE